MEDLHVPILWLQLMLVLTAELQALKLELVMGLQEPLLIIHRLPSMEDHYVITTVLLLTYVVTV
jgi:hypothetical protein